MHVTGPIGEVVHITKLLFYRWIQMEHERCLNEGPSFDWQAQTRGYG